MTLGCVLARKVELTLQVLLSDLNITQGHADIFVAQHLLQAGKTDAQAEHFSCVRVPEPVGGYMLRASGSFASANCGAPEDIR